MGIGAALVRRRLVAPLLAAALLAALVSLWAVDRADGGTPEHCARLAAASAERLAHDTETPTGTPTGPSTGARIVVIGDSYSVGSGLDDTTASWPTRLSDRGLGRVHVAGFAGSGFSADASPCGPAVSYARRAAAAVRGGADLVVVEGGLNDHDQSAAAIGRGLTDLMGALEGAGVAPGQVVVVGPPLAPDRPEAAARVDDVLARLVRAQGATYASVVGLDLPYLDDALHLTEAGHAAFGDEVARHLTHLTGAGRAG